MELGRGRAIDRGEAVRIIEDALAIFRGHHRGHRPDWVEISGRRFPCVDGDGFTIVLTTPFQRVDLVRPPGCHGWRQVATYGVDVFARAKVFSARWDARGTRVDVLAPGTWRLRLSSMAEAAITGPGEVALRTATVRAAHPRTSLANPGGGLGRADPAGPASRGDASEVRLLQAAPGPDRTSTHDGSA